MKCGKSVITTTDVLYTYLTVIIWLSILRAY